MTVQTLAVWGYHTGNSQDFKVCMNHAKGLRIRPSVCVRGNLGSLRVASNNQQLVPYEPLDLLALGVAIDWVTGLSSFGLA